jgi:putative AlgH/UPF0301 family transcriptional regulator
MRQRFEEIVDLTFGFRNCILVAAVFAGSTALLIAHQINGMGWVDINKALGIAFLAQHGFEGAMGVLKQHLASKKIADVVEKAEDAVEKL